MFVEGGVIIINLVEHEPSRFVGVDEHIKPAAAPLALQRCSRIRGDQFPKTLSESSLDEEFNEHNERPHVSSSCFLAPGPLGKEW